MSVDFVFEDEELYNICDGDGFDMLYEYFNEAISSTGYAADDVIEPDSELSEDEAIVPIEITRKMILKK